MNPYALRYGSNTDKIAWVCNRVGALAWMRASTSARVAELNTVSTN